MLFEPIQIGSLTLENRLLRSATWEGMATEDGEVTDQVVALYDELGQGEIGLIVTGFAYVLPDGKALPGQLGIYDDALVAGLSRIAQAVHAHGAKVAVQIVHAGAQGRPEFLGGYLPRGPSAAVGKDGAPEAEALSHREIEEAVQAFGDAGRRAREAGFDAVQIHLAHGYLLSQFLSPARNRRKDAYGGSPENRRRAPLEAYQAVRRAVGDDFPVLVKLNSSDCVEGGLELAEATACAQALEEAGLDGIEISGGIPAAGKLGSARANIRTLDDEAYFRAGCAAIKRQLRIPTWLVGGLRSPELADEILAAGDADGVALCRPFIREPDLARRWRMGDPAVSECISCRRCLKAGMQGGIRCVDVEEKAR